MADGDVLDAYRHPDDRARVAEAVARSVAAVGVLNIEFRIVLDSGEQKWVHLQSRPMPADGPGQERVGVLIDITAQKRAAEWRQARDRAETADRAKTQLLSRVSHELRTPLNAVLGFGQLLVTDATLDPRHRAWVQQIVASGQHLLALVEDVLDVSSAQAGQLSLACAAVDLRQVLAETWSALEVSSSPGDLHFDGDGMLGPPLWVQADARRLKQVANNLLSNAIQYNRPGGRVSVRMQVISTPQGVRVELRVADTGIGMTAAQVARLFKPFERVGTQHIGVQGSGLGLALSKQLVEALCYRRQRMSG
jgi:signal transduction histidine kinase